MELLNSFCWSNAYPVLVFVCEAENQQINMDDLEIKVNQDKIDILERIDFLIEKGIPLKYDEKNNIVRLTIKEEIIIGINKCLICEKNIEANEGYYLMKNGIVKIVKQSFCEKCGEKIEKFILSLNEIGKEELETDYDKLFSAIEYISSNFKQIEDYYKNIKITVNEWNKCKEELLQKEFIEIIKEDIVEDPKE